MDPQRAVIALALLLSACAAPAAERLAAASEGPRRAEVAAVPSFPQREHHCGPAALAAALAWSGQSVSPELVAPLVYTPGREGSLAADLLAAARRRGRLAVPVGQLDQLLAELAAGHPVVALLNFGLGPAPRWHFAVASGYDLDARQITLDGEPTSLDTFEFSWERADRWAMVVLPPDTLPASAGELAVARAAAGLERAGQPAAAVLAFRAMAERWPDSQPAAVGMGNALHALGRDAEAVAALRAAAERHPEWELVKGNLAELSPLPAGEGLGEGELSATGP